jgi:hypothetical protein
MFSFVRMKMWEAAVFEFNSSPTLNYYQSKVLGIVSLLQ